MATQLPQLLTDWLEEANPEHRDQLVTLHELLMAAEPEFEVSSKWGQPAYSARGETFAYLADQKNYVQLGFYNGAQFDDPHGIVEGTGKRLRHVKVSSIDDEMRSKLTDVIHASLAAGSEY